MKVVEGVIRGIYASGLDNALQGTGVLRLRMQRDSDT